ncbi:MAG: protein kinase [Candidatus Aminicenantes bacterium]|nr:protein kinase [Candidatus Aminicenantes bacterium]
MGNKDKTIKCPQCQSLNPEGNQFCDKCGFILIEKAETLTYTDSYEKAATDTLGFSPGEKFGPRYRIIEEIGRGGMGRVYKAEDTELNITVALKMIRPLYSKDPHFIQNFKEETILARSISHENVIRIHDLGEVNDIKFISMEYIKGHDLKDLIHTSGALSAETTISIAKQICLGLKAAHQKNIVHLDLKPRNIMIDYSGHAYIMDFGVSKSLKARKMERKKKVAGTLPYISPEQAKGEEVDQRTDIYSLGIILFEMLTGKLPFEAHTAKEYIQKHLQEKPPPITELKSDVPPTLQKIIMKCLHKNPENRYQDCDEILKDLESTGLDIKSVKYKKPLSLFQRPFFYLALFLVVSVTAYFLFFSGNRKGSVIPGMTQITMSVLPFQNNSGEGSLDHYRKDFQEMIITDLEQSKYLHVIPTLQFDALLTKMQHKSEEAPSKKVLDKIAQNEDIRYFVQGNYSKFGDILRFSIKIIKPFSYETLSTRIIQVEKGQEGDLLDRIDDLTVWIKTNLGFKRYEIINDYDEKIKNFTKSEQALRLYYKGEKSYIEGKFEESNQFLKEAIKLDPEFAMAFRSISINYAYLQNLSKAQEYSQKALDLAHEGRGSLREKLLIEGYAHYLEGSVEKAVSKYKEVLEIYPYDEDAHSFLGAIYRNMGENDLAEQHFLKAILYIPDTAHSSLVWIYLQKGLYTKAADLLESNKDIINPKVYYIHLAEVYFCKGEVDTALKYALKVEEIFPEDYQNLEFLGNIYQIKGDMEKSRQYYLALLKNHNTIASSIQWQHYLMIQEGRFSDCEDLISENIRQVKKQNDKYSELDFLFLLSFVQYHNHKYVRCQQTIGELFQEMESIEEYSFIWYSILGQYVSGLASAQLNNFPVAEKKAEVMMGLINRIQSQSQGQFLQYYHHLKGMIALKKEDYSTAIEYFKKGYSLLPSQNDHYDNHALFLDSLGQAYYFTKKTDQALKCYNDIQTLTTGRLSWGNLYVLSYYWLGKIEKDRGHSEQALEHFKQFLKYWENADPELPEILEAKKFVSSLHNE